MPAAMLTGALALAGCGGSGTTGDPEKCPAGYTGTPGNCTKIQTGGDGFTDADVPDGANGITYNTSNQPIKTLAPGKDEVPLGSNVTVRCPSTATGPCRWRVTASNGIEVTGGATVVLTASIQVPVGGNTPPPAAEADPLSAATLAEALKGTGSKKTIWSNADESLAPTSDIAQPTQRTTLAGEDLKLTLKGNAALHWGHWHRSTPAATAGGKPTGVKRGTFFGGATPYGVKPEVTLDSAKYGTKGGSANNVNLYSKYGKGDWTSREANLYLEANFKAGKVGGEITGVAYGGTGPTTITLKETDIADSGTFSGGAELDGDAFKGRSGNWKGGFYGETTKLMGTEVKHKAPGHVAGDFSVAGHTGAGSTKKDLLINGAFGTACNPACP